MMTLETYDLGDSQALAGLCVAVVGLGALGSEVARLLGCRGAGEVMLVDPDRLEERNLPYSRLAREAVALGLVPENPLPAKVDAAAAVGGRLHPGTRWHPVCCEIADAPMQELAACEVIFSCTDNTLARAETALLSRLLGKPMIDGGLKGEAAQEGRASYFAPAAACYLCRLSARRRMELLQWAAASSLGCAVEQPQSSMSGAPAMGGVVAAAMVEIALRCVRGAPEKECRASRAWVYRAARDNGNDLSVLERQEIQLAQSADCPWHDAIGRGALRPIAPGLTVGAALRAHAAESGEGPVVLELLWPLCLEARCLRCGTRCRPQQRVARVRRGRCPACREQGALQPISCLRTIHADDPSAQYTVAELGMPEQHLFWFRTAYSGVSEE